MAKDRGARVEPHIYRRNNGGFIVRVRQKNVELTRVARTLTDARLVLRQILLSKNGIVFGEKPRTLNDILESYVQYLQARGKSAETARWLNSKILAFFGQSRLAPLTDEDLELWGAHAQAEYVRRGLSHIRTVHKRAKLPVPNMAEYEYEPGSRLEPEEDTVIALLDAMPWGSPERATAELMKLTLVRLWHIQRLKIEDVSGPSMVVRSRKGRGLNKLKVEYHPISEEVRRVLDSVILPNAPRDRYVIQLDGHQLLKGSLRKRLLAASRRAKITPPIQSLSWMRNFGATWLIEHGTPVEVVSRMLGHESIATTLKHYDKAKLRKQRLDASGALSGVGTVGTGPHQNPTPCPEKTSNDPVEKGDTLPVV